MLTDVTHSSVMQNTSVTVTEAKYVVRKLPAGNETQSKHCLRDKSSARSPNLKAMEGLTSAVSVRQFCTKWCKIDVVFIMRLLPVEAGDCFSSEGRVHRPAFTIWLCKGYRFH